MSENLTHLYKITNKINNKIYFGITSQNPPIKRWTGHKSVAKVNKKNRPLYNSMNKYGVENFTFEIIKSDKNREYIANLEIECIKEYKTQDSNFGYNLANGGEINTGFTIPKEVREKRSKEMMGSKNTFYGKNIQAKV